MNLEEQLNFYGEKKEPFFFIINYDKTEYEVIPLDNLPQNIKYTISQKQDTINHNQTLEKKHISFENYKEKFYQLENEILNGNTYLANLTSKTQIQNLPLQQ